MSNNLVKGKKLAEDYNLSLIFSTSVFTCVTLGKAGLVVGPLRLSVRPSVRNTRGTKFV